MGDACLTLFVLSVALVVWNPACLQVRPEDVQAFFLALPADQELVLPRQTAKL